MKKEQPRKVLLGTFFGDPMYVETKSKVWTDENWQDQWQKYLDYLKGEKLRDYQAEHWLESK